MRVVADAIGDAEDLADDGHFWNSGRAEAKVSARSPSTMKPSFASAIAGAISCASVNLPDPYFRCASASPATVPGTPTPSPEKIDFCGSAFPSASRKLSLVIAAGAVSR